MCVCARERRISFTSSFTSSTSLIHRSDGSRSTSPSSNAPPPQRHVSGSLKDRIAKFENLGGGSSAPAPVPRQYGGAQGSYARGGLVGNRLPSLDPKTAGLPSAGTGPRRVSERRDLIGNRVPSSANANAAAVLAPRHTGGSSSSAPPPTVAATPTPASVSTSALGLGRPGAPCEATKDDEAKSEGHERPSSPTSSSKESAPSGPGSTAGSVSAASSSVVSAQSNHSGSAPTSATSSPATSPGGALPPHLLVSSLPGQDDAGATTPLSTRAEAGEEAPSELSMPATPIASNPDLPPPGYDLVPGNLALAAGPTSSAMAPSPSISSSLVSQYDPKSEGEDSANLKDVSNVSTPTGTPRQAHKTLEDDGSIAGSVAGSTRGAPEEVEEKMSTLAVDDKVEEESASASAAEITPVTATESREPLFQVKALEKEDPPTPSFPATTPSASREVLEETPPTPIETNHEGEEKNVALKEDNGSTPTPDDPANKPEESETPASPAIGTVVGATAAVAAAVTAAATLPIAAATTMLSKEAEVDASPAEPEVREEEAPEFSKGAADETSVVAHNEPAQEEETDSSIVDKMVSAAADRAGRDVDAPVVDKLAHAAAARATEESEEPKVEEAPPSGTSATTAALSPFAAREEPAIREAEALAIPDVEELADSIDSLDPPKPDNSSEVTAIVPHFEAANDPSASPTETSFRSVFVAGGRDRDITPLASQLNSLNSLSLDGPSPLDREATPVPEHCDLTTDQSQPPPALDDDSDIVSVMGAAMSDRGDDLHSNRSSMPPARASSELEFRYEDLHERFFRESLAKEGHGPGSISDDAPTSSAFVASVRFEPDGQSSGSQPFPQAEGDQAAASPDAGIHSPPPSAVVASSGVLASAATHSFRESTDSTSPPVVDARCTAGDVMIGPPSFPSVPSTDLEGRRPVQVHIEPSPYGVISPAQPALNVQAPSPLGLTFQNGDESKLSISSGSSSGETSRVTTPAPPSFPSAPGNDIPNSETPSRTSTPSIGMMPDGVTPGLLHNFPPVPDEEHPYVEVHMSPHHHAQTRVPFPRSASDRSGLGLARNTSSSLSSTPKRSSSLRAPLTPPTENAPFAMRPISPTPGSSSSPNLSIESCSDRPPGFRATGRHKRNSFTPRSPHLDDEDPGDFEPGEGWAIVNRWEPWRSPSQNSM